MPAVEAFPASGTDRSTESSLARNAKLCAKRRICRAITPLSRQQLAYWRKRTGNPTLTSEQAATLSKPRGSLLAGLEKAFNPGRVYNVQSRRKRRSAKRTSTDFGVGLGAGSLTP